MNRIARALAALALVFVVGGCAKLISGQFIVDQELASPLSTAPAGSPEGVALPIPQPIDLTTEDEYEDHKDELKSVSDLAVLGTLENNGGTEVNLEIWMTTGATGVLTEEQVRAQGVQLWGPYNLPVGSGQVVMNWDRSAAQFKPAGKELLIQEAKGDGQFTLYLMPSGGSYTLTNGHLVLVLNAGK